MLVLNYPEGPQTLIASKSLKQLDEDLPERFYHDDWKVVFFKSDLIRRIVKSNFVNLELISSYMNRRNAYAQHYIETQNNNEKTKEDILRRM